jgi:hyperosmotically inducible periplasmic protein
VRAIAGLMTGIVLALSLLVHETKGEFMLRRTFTGLAAALVVAPPGLHAQIPLPQRTLAYEIERELLQVPEYTLFDWIEAEVLADGSITLRGQATKNTEQSVLAHMHQLPGAQNLQDEIEILPNGYDDVRLRFRVFSTLFGANSALLRYATRAVPPIHIIVKQGAITLKGEVAQLAESMLAEAKVRGVRGVRNVKNELRVVPPYHQE